MSLVLGPEPFQKFGVGGGWWWVGGWSKGILEFRFSPNLGLRLGAWTKLNNCRIREALKYYVIILGEGGLLKR